MNNLRQPPDVYHHGLDIRMLTIIKNITSSSYPLFTKNLSVIVKILSFQEIDVLTCFIYFLIYFAQVKEM
ncbi:hypothetical protein BMS3Abin07_01553 [bacterium BMS3Abin07]|nr:hypothetical protein BMS3Abin07_01553 [bacterium BMS3Abin07]GBE32131.1 hypothetical protein BMS3Bbin05_01040 [bacterium BMS3Bbin05]